MDRLDERLDDWVAAGLIDPEQAERIRTFESDAASGPADARPNGMTGGTRWRLAEALGYLGGALAVLAAVLLVGEFWDELETWARLLLLLTTSALLLAAGAWARVTRVEAVGRLGGFLWFASVVTWAFAVGIAIDRTVEPADETTVLVVGLLSVSYAAPLWWWRREALQQLAVFAGLAAALLAALGHVEHIEPEGFGMSLWALAVSWGLFTWAGPVRPTRTGYVVAGFAALAGSQVVSFGAEPGWGHALGLLTAAILLAASVAVGSFAMMGLGAAGAFVFVAQIVFEYFADTIGVPLALFVVGVLLIGAAVLTAHLKPRVDAASDRDPGP